MKIFVFSYCEGNAFVIFAKFTSIFFSVYYLTLDNKLMISVHQHFLSDPPHFSTLFLQQLASHGSCWTWADNISSYILYILFNM